MGKPLKSLGTPFLTIEWPRNTDKKKWLLYLTEITTKGTDNIACRPDVVNELKLKAVSHTSFTLDMGWVFV